MLVSECIQQNKNNKLKKKEHINYAKRREEDG
jgi:hypothetical protein